MCKRSTVQNAKSSFLTGQLNTSAASHLAQAKRAWSLKIRMVGILSFVSMVTARGNGQRPREPKPCRGSRLHPDERIVLLRSACWVEPFATAGPGDIRGGSDRANVFRFAPESRLPVIVAALPDILCRCR